MLQTGNEVPARQLPLVRKQAPTLPRFPPLQTTPRPPTDNPAQVARQPRRHQQKIGYAGGTKNLATKLSAANEAAVKRVRETEEGGADSKRRRPPISRCWVSAVRQRC